MTEADIPEALSVFLLALEGAGVSYVIGGSVASSLHGTPRTTHDVDILVELDESSLEPVLCALRPRFYVPETLSRQAVEARSSFSVVDLESGDRIDVFVAGADRLDREQLRRRVVTELPMGRVFVTSPEILILRKLLWYRSGGEVSERQWNDVLGMLAVQNAALDDRLLDDLAVETGVSDLLARARAEQGEDHA